MKAMKAMKAIKAIKAIKAMKAMNSIKAFFGPTLVRRVFFALLITNVAIWNVSLAYTSYFENDSFVELMMKMTERASYRLERYTSEADAASFAMAWKRIFPSFEIDEAYPGHVEVWTRDGKRIYFDPHQAAYPPIMGNSHQVSQVLIDGERYFVFREDGPRWSLRARVPVFSYFSNLKKCASAQAFYTGFFFSFPVMMLPLWFALRRGVRPLRALSERLIGRDADDLSPLDFDARYGEIKPLVAAIDALLQRLRGKILHEQAFVQDAAHELRTPLAVISAQAYLLAQAQTSTDWQEAGQHIEHAMARAGHLIRQLVQLAEVDAIRNQDNHQHDVAQLVKRALEQMAPVAALRQIQLSLAAPPALHHQLEKSSFLSIVHNLIDNAIRYGHVGGSVAVALEKDGSGLLLEVADDGPGIGVDERELVFQRFYRGVGHQASGSGLGLAIVQQAALRLGATVELSAGLLGKGCRFVLHIPSAKLQATHPPGTGGPP